MSTGSNRATIGGGVLAFLGILFVGLSLRSIITSISPLLVQISTEITLGTLALGIISAAPTLAYALSGFLAPTVARRVGLERAVLLMLGVMVLGHLARAVAFDSTLILVGTLVTLLGSGICNVLVPPLIKRYFPHRIGVVTAVYVASLAVSGAFPALVAVPIAEVTGWRFALGVWAVATVVAAVPWLLELRAARARRHDDTVLEPASSQLAGRMSRSWIAWSIVGLFAMCSFGGFTMLVWLPTVLVEIAEVDAATAGALLSLFGFCGLPIAVVIPTIAARYPRTIVPIVAIGMISFAVGYSGFLFAPAAAPLGWVLLLGLGSLPYPLCFTLIGLRTRSTESALRLSGFVNAVGYAIAAIGPFTVSLLYGLTGGWVAPFAFLLAAVLLGVPALVVLGRPRYVEDELADRAQRRASRP